MGELEVLAHAVGVDRHPRGDAGRQVLHVVEQDRRVGQDHPLGAGVGDVALVPEGDVLEPGLRVAAQHAGEAGDPLGEDRVALVGHRRGALLAGAERLLDLADLGPLQVADLGREALEAGAGERDPRGQQLRVAVARDHLGGDVLAPQAEPLHHPRLDRGRHRGVGADRAGELADGELLEGVARGAAGCGRPRRRSRRGAGRRSSARRGRRGCGRRRACRGARAPARSARRGRRARRASRISPACAQLQRERRVEHVGGGQAVVDPAPVLADRGGDDVDEGGDVVVGDPLALVDRLDREGGVRPRTPRPPRAGTTPSSAQASVAASSTSSQHSMLALRRSRPRRSPVAGVPRRITR